MLLFAREAWSRGRSVAVVVDDADRLRPSLHAAVRLARASRSPLTVVLTGGALADQRGSAQRVLEVAAAHGVELGDVLTAPAATAPALERAVRFCRARLLVLPAGEAPDDAQRVVELLRRLPSALMLVRG